MHKMSSCAFLKVLLPQKIVHGHAGCQFKWGLSRHFYDLKNGLINGTFVLIRTLDFCSSGIGFSYKMSGYFALVVLGINSFTVVANTTVKAQWKSNGQRCKLILSSIVFFHLYILEILCNLSPFVS